MMGRAGVTTKNNRRRLPLRKRSEEATIGTSAKGGDYYEAAGSKREGVGGGDERQIPSFERAIRDTGGPRGYRRVDKLLSDIDAIKSKYARRASAVPARAERKEHEGVVSGEVIHYYYGERLIYLILMKGGGFVGRQNEGEIPGAGYQRALGDTGRGGRFSDIDRVRRSVRKIKSGYARRVSEESEGRDNGSQKMMNTLYIRRKDYGKVERK
jgi:hypothetical protein